MQLFYIVSALVVSIGVNSFAGADSQRQIAMTAEKNRAAAMEQQAHSFARALRREVQLNPGRFSSVSQSGQIRIPDDVVAGLDFGGYRGLERYEFFLRNNGQIVSRIASSARYGANALNDRADIISERIQNPGQGLQIGRLDLSDLGL